MAELVELIDKEILIRLQQKFSNLLGFNVAFADKDSRIVGLENSEEQRPALAGSVCDQMKGTKEGKRRCYESDLEAGKLIASPVSGNPSRNNCGDSNRSAHNA